jgi:hypothetical protein
VRPVKLFARFAAPHSHSIYAPLLIELSSFEKTRARSPAFRTKKFQPQPQLWPLEDDRKDSDTLEHGVEVVKSRGSAFDVIV